jgi:hypothetical protein
MIFSENRYPLFGIMRSRDGGGPVDGMGGGRLTDQCLLSFEWPGLARRFLKNLPNKTKPSADAARAGAAIK